MRSDSIRRWAIGRRRACTWPAAGESWVWDQRDQTTQDCHSRQWQYAVPPPCYEEHRAMSDSGDLLPAISFAFEYVGRGWAHASISNGAETYGMGPSYVGSDP